MVNSPQLSTLPKVVKAVMETPSLTVTNLYTMVLNFGHISLSFPPGAC